ncbi:MAG: hypothetical protein AAGF57_15035 [Pseudomonadota bacterium]
MNNPRHVTGLLFVTIASSFIAAHMLLRPVDHELIWVQIPHSNATGGGSISAVQTPETIALETDDIKAAFERDTVVSLNNIVRQSLSVIREYDAEISSIRKEHSAAMREQATEEQRTVARVNLTKMRTWMHATSLAASDMNAAVIQLEASDEHYNAAILAGMVRFVNTVAEEIRTEHARISEEHRLAML